MLPAVRRIWLKRSLPGDLLLVDTTCSLFREAPTPHAPNIEFLGRVLAGTVVIFFQSCAVREPLSGCFGDNRMVKIFSPAGIGWVWADYVRPLKFDNSSLTSPVTPEEESDEK